MYKTIYILAAFKDSDLGWTPNSIGIAIHDYDDFDIGLIYKTEEEHFMNVLHELINWMYDHEQGISLYKALLNPFEFFPNCNCEKNQLVKRECKNKGNSSQKWNCGKMTCWR